MFRRFMIVCWVLFAISAFSGLVGWLACDYYEGKIEAIAMASPYEKSSDGPIDFAAELRDQSSKEFAPGDIVSAEEFFGQDDTIVVKPDASDGSDANEKRAAIALTVAIIGLLASCFLLTWNILCHTTHWIWMGRKQ